MSGSPPPPAKPIQQYDPEEMIARGGKLKTDENGRKVWEFSLYNSDNEDISSSDEEDPPRPSYYARPSACKIIKPPKQKTQKGSQKSENELVQPTTLPDDFLDDGLDFRFEIAYEKKKEEEEAEEGGVIPGTDREEEVVEKEVVTEESSSAATDSATEWVWKWSRERRNEREDV